MILSPDELPNKANMYKRIIVSQKDMGDKIKARMKECEISQVDLADKMHVSKQTVI